MSGFVCPQAGCHSVDDRSVYLKVQTSAKTMFPIARLYADSLRESWRNVSSTEAWLNVSFLSIHFVTPH